MARVNTQTSPIILSSEAAQELAELLPSIPIFGAELNAFVHQIKASMDRAKRINQDGDEAVIQIVVYPIGKA